MNPPSLAEQVEAALTAAGLSKSDRLLLGFSGGRDSVALLELLLEGGFQKITLAHLDHGLRPDSAADADWIEKLARLRGIPLAIARADIADHSTSRRSGLEQAAREARLSFFRECASKYDTNKVVLAHHADDQVETLLFRLLRGAGSPGLGAMQLSIAHSGGSCDLLLLRPMLGIWRSEIDAYVGQHKLDFREDSSNAQTDFTRNRIRHILLPELERVMERPVRATLLRTADILRAESDFIDHSERSLPPLGTHLEAGFLRSLPLAIRRRRITRWLAQQGVPNISFDLVEAVSGLVTSRTPAKINLPGGRHARRKGGLIFCE